MFDLEKDVETIDKYNLDEECIKQPQLYWEAAKLAADLAEKRDAAKIDMEVLYGELFESLKNSKASDKTVEAMILSNPAYIEARRYFVKCKADAYKASALEGGYEQRKYMLEYIIKLYLSEYFSEVNSKMDTLSKSISARKIKEELYTKGD